MRHIDEDTITQAVIARHAAAGDARLREVMTSLVQHLHAFAREVKLTEAEWDGGVRFLAECGRAHGPGRPEMALLSDTLGLSALVTALNHRKPRGCTEASVSSWAPAHHAATDDAGELCFVRGVVQALDGTPIAGAEVSHGHAGDDAGRDRWFTGPDGAFLLKTRVAGPQPITHGGPVGRLLHDLGRHPWRPAHLSFIISAPGYERLVTHIFRQGDPFLDADAAFGVRGSLIADWVRHERGRTPDGHTSDRPFTTLDFAFVLNATTGDKP